MAGGRAPYQKPDKEWRTLDWLPGYEISEDGDVWNGFRLLAGCIQGEGYRIYKLTRATVGKKVYKAHRLVCEAWHGTAPEGKTSVAHNDGDAGHNHYSNVRWATHQENVRDRLAHGTDASGERNPKAKMTWAQVCEIRETYTGRRGEKSAIARKYGVSVSAITQVLNGTRWPADRLLQGTPAKKSKVSAKGRYVKGRAYEYELRDEFIKYGFPCRRVIQSGGGVEKDDLVVTTPWGEEYRIEAKRRGKLPGYLVNPTCQATIFRPDRGESMVLISFERFLSLIQCK